MKDNKGSIWRKWDLHFHTPSSYDYKDSSVTNDDIINKLVEKSVGVIAVTDHHFMDVQRIKDLQTLGKGKITVLPGIEFLADARGNDPIHFIGIFSEDCNLEYIWGQIENNTSIKKIKGEGKKHNEVYCDLIETIQLIKGLGGITSIHAGQKSNTVENITHALPHGAAQKTDIAMAIDIYELGKEADQVGYRDIVFPAIKKVIPMVICSDNHDIKNYIIKQNLWIKAEPSFEGLKQIINEPNRAFIGELPPVLKRVKDFPTKFIQSIKISKIENSPITDVWFNDFEVSLNYELSAIIGNKGKGKSALSDIIGLSGNAHVDPNDYSFLHRDKFRNPITKFAPNYVATINWVGGESSSKMLDANPDLNSPERVKYIPQSFLEKLCTSIDKKVFEDELEKVIFSRLENHQKLGKGNLKEIINEKKSAIENEISQIKNQLSTINVEIIELENKNSTAYRTAFRESLLGKINELNVHEEAKPSPVDAPSEDDESRKKTLGVTEKISSLREEIKNQNDTKDVLQKELNVISLEINELDQLTKNFTTLSDYISTFITTNDNLVKKYGVDISKVITYSISTKEIGLLLDAKRDRKSDIDKVFLLDNLNNPNIIISEKEKQIKNLQEELEGKNREYQKYLTDLQEWEKNKATIIGALDKEGSLEYLKERASYLDKHLIKDIELAYARRINLLKQLLQKKEEIAIVYKELYEPVSLFISQNRNELSDYNVNIDVALEINAFPEKFFGYVSNGVAGSFYGAIESRQLLTKLSETVNFNDVNQVVAWIGNILSHLQVDKRSNQGDSKRELKAQLKGGYNEKEFYDFLFSMEYYEPSYQLKLGIKKLNELSPGERGALLLIFYLLLDNRDIPIIIDQPEENLDNQSVFKILVHFIKKAKEKRQIIIVTHNPNLAVVCDAEQIIKMDIAKENRNTVEMITGGIENKVINSEIVNILEGTRPAFDNRNSKYNISKS